MEPRTDCIAPLRALADLATVSDRAPLDGAPAALQGPVRAACALLTGGYPSQPPGAPWWALYEPWRVSAAELARALPERTRAERAARRATWEALDAADAAWEALGCPGAGAPGTGRASAAGRPDGAVAGQDGGGL